MSESSFHPDRWRPRKPLRRKALESPPDVSDETWQLVCAAQDEYPRFADAELAFFLQRDGHDIDTQTVRGVLQFREEQTR